MKKFTRVMAGLVCGAIVASSSSVAAFAADGASNVPVTVSRAVKNGKIQIVSRVQNQQEQNANQVTVQLIPDEGFEVDDIFNANLHANYPFTTDTYADQSIVCIDKENNIYTFEMPWNSTGVVLTANFAQK